MVSQRGTGHGGPQTLSAAGVFWKVADPKDGERGGPRQGEADGTSECPGVSTHERGAGAPSLTPGTSQQADKSIRVRNAGERLLPRPRFGSTTFAQWAEPLLVCRYLSNGVRAARLATGRVAE